MGLFTYLRLFALMRRASLSVETDHPAGFPGYLQRFMNIDRRIRALEAFMVSINSTSVGNGGNLTTSSTTYANTSPVTTASAQVGLSGNMLVIGSAQLDMNSGATGSAGLLQGSSLLIDPFFRLVNNSGGEIAAGNAAANLLTGFTPYSTISFTLKFKTSSAGVALTVGGPTLVVVPV